MQGQEGHQTQLAGAQGAHPGTLRAGLLLEDVIEQEQKEIEKLAGHCRVGRAYEARERLAVRLAIGDWQEKLKALKLMEQRS